MKLRRSRHGRLAGSLHSPGEGPSARRVTAMFVAMALAFVLYPVGATAAGRLINAVITDPGGANAAHVDADGGLQVGGTVDARQSGQWEMAIAGTPTVSVQTQNMKKVETLTFSVPRGASQHQYLDEQVDATTIIITKSPDKVAVSLQGPFGPFGQEDGATVLLDESGTNPGVAFSFTYPLTLDGATVECLNFVTERDTCDVDITVMGF
jgi:hypothetical protein